MASTETDIDTETQICPGSILILILKALVSAFLIRYRYSRLSLMQGGLYLAIHHFFLAFGGTTMVAQHLEISVGDEVGFYQDQFDKDTSGWFGPAVVADVGRLKHGAVTVRYNNKLREVSVQKIRRHIFFCFLSATPPQSLHLCLEHRAAGD